MIENTYYWLMNEGEEPTLVYYYKNPDAFMDPNVFPTEGTDYSALGFGFNIADGGGFLLENDLTEDTTVMQASIVKCLNT